MSEFSTEELVGILKRLYECFPVEQFKTTDEIIRHDIAYQKIRRRLEASHPDYTKQYIPMPKKVSRKSLYQKCDELFEILSDEFDPCHIRAWIEGQYKELGIEVGDNNE